MILIERQFSRGEGKHWAGAGQLAGRTERVILIDGGLRASQNQGILPVADAFFALRPSVRPLIL
jgi:hypothetical protein